MSIKPLLAQLHSLLKDQANQEHAEYHRAYHKSERKFYGLRAPQLKSIFREVFPARAKVERDDVIPLVDELYFSDWAEERWLAVMLLQRIVTQLRPEDTDYVRRLADACEGWGDTDSLSIMVLGPLALRRGTPVYKPVRQWSTAPHMWTRRASILVHVIPARRGQLNDKYAWPTFDELLPEREFFIRKAIGWTLRECSKKYPEQVADFLIRAGDRASGLTRREGGRNLPEELQVKVFL